VSFLLDTNVLSELVRRKPDAGVRRWFQSAPEEALHLSVLSVGELRCGIESAAHGARREKLRVWLERDLADRFSDRLLSITPAVADRWGRLLAEMDRSVPAIDSLLAATALTYGLRIVTRNVRDFRYPGLQVVNPWEAGRA
jgi:predicted nucleic acid-binding protein